jgi:phospholipid transport system transporter-binding protein
MLHRDGNKLVVQGPVTIDNVVEITQQGASLFDGNDLIVDLKKVTEVDSAIVSMLLEWLRNARNQNHQLQFMHVPQNLASLIQLYGIAELIPLSVDNQQLS